MNKEKIFNLTTTVLITALIVGFASCSKDKKEPEPDLSCEKIMGKWYNTLPQDPRYYLEFKTNNTYSWITDNETIDGIYKIIEKKQTTVDILEIIGDSGDIRDATLYKMLVSGSNVFDQMWVYEFPDISKEKQLVIHLYSGNERVQILKIFCRRWQF